MGVIKFFNEQNQRLNFTLISRISFAAFGVYFCMYGFRKPFTVASFENLTLYGIDYKILLIIVQSFGYMLSKFLGIKIISEMKKKDRIKYLIVFILIAEIALLGFAVIPRPYNILCFFLNGLPLGMIWGIVFSYIEGRKVTEILGVILCSSFIISSGFVKTVGKIVIVFLGVNEFWMPFISGMLFIIPLFIFASLLEKAPAPTMGDHILRIPRKPLRKVDRMKFIKEYSLPFSLIVLFFLILTAVKDFRDNFARELWDDLGVKSSNSIYTLSEMPIVITVFFILTIIGGVMNNSKAFMYYHLVLIFGNVLILLATICFQNQLINPVLWMILTGSGLFICYVPFNGLYFDRMIAVFKIEGNVGFLIYIADAFGYVGSVLILLSKNFNYTELSNLNFYIYIIYSVGVLGLLVSISVYVFFNKKMNKEKQKLSTKESMEKKKYSYL